MSKLFRSLALMGLLLSACSDPATLKPEPAAPAAQNAPGVSTPAGDAPASNIGEKSSAPVELTRFFCEDGAIYDSLLTFTSRATADALPSSIFFEDPAKPGFQLTGIRAPMVLSTNADNAVVLFQAVSRTGKIGQPVRRTGIYLAQVDLLNRTSQTRLLGPAPEIPSEALRLAHLAGLRLRSFGMTRGTLLPAGDGSQVLVPAKQGYQLLDLSSERAREIGVVKCPPSNCWNPEIVGEEIWFAALNPETGKFMIRAFARAPERGFEALPFPSQAAGSQQIATNDLAADAGWIEETGKSFYLGIRNEKSDATYFELPASVRGYLPKAIRLANWNGLGESAVVASPTEQGHEQLWVVTIDRSASRTAPEREIPLPAAGRLSEFVRAEPDVLYATFFFGKGPVGSKLMRYSPENQNWQTLTRGACENPSVGYFHE